MNATERSHPISELWLQEATVQMKMYKIYFLKSFVYQILFVVVYLSFIYHFVFLLIFI